MRRLGLILGLAGCSTLPVSALIRSPIDDKCRAYGLKACPELVDGAIAYAEGNKPLALEKLERGRALNTPEQLKQFAVALRSVGESAPDAGRPLLEVAALLSAATPPPSDAAPPLVPADPYQPPAESVPAARTPPGNDAAASAEIPGEDTRRASVEPLILSALSARTDPLRLVSESVWPADAPGVECKVGDAPALCVQPKSGPLIVTDVVASEECAQRAFLVAADSDTPGLGLRWLVPARTSGVHGGSFFIPGWQSLFIAIKPPVKPQPSDRACFVTWTGFKPRLVPAPTRDTAFQSRR